MLTIQDLDDVKDAIQSDSRVAEMDRVDDMRGVIILVRASNQSAVEDIVGDPTAVYTVDGDPDGTYRIGLPMELP